MPHEFKDILHSTTHVDEKTYAIIHRHWFDMASQFIPIFFFILGTTALLFFGDTLFATEAEAFYPLFYFVISLLYLAAWIYGFSVWVNYFLDVWVVTSSRVINIEQKGFFSRHISELDYNNIQDVSSGLHGVLQSLVNYGDVVVQTAGSDGKFLFRRVARPEKVKALVMHLHRQAHSKKVHPTFIAQEKSGSQGDVNTVI